MNNKETDQMTSMEEKPLSRRSFLRSTGVLGMGLAGGALYGASLAYADQTASAAAASTSTASAPTSASTASASATASAASAGSAPASASSASIPASQRVNGPDVPHVEHPLEEVVNWSWETAPDPIADSDIADKKQCDVLVIGGGWSGLCAAVAAAEQGASVIVSEKLSSCIGKGGQIAAFGSKVVKDFASQGYFKEADYAEVTRRLVMWCHGRVKEPLHWEFARKSGACMDWLVDIMDRHNITVGMWDGYYKGPDYTEAPVTHIFYDKDTDWKYENGVSKGVGQDVTVPAMVDEATTLGVQFLYETPGVRLLRQSDGPVTGAILQNADGQYIEVDATSTILCTGDYIDDDEMRTRYAPFSWTADSRLYIPVGISTGDMHKAAMWVGAAMQEYEPHALAIHLESGAESYNFLHVNGEGNRFMNEDVNTQSKSCAKALQPGRRAFTIYDSTSLQKFADACDQGLCGGIASDQHYRIMGKKYDMDFELQVQKDMMNKGVLFQADSLDELAGIIDVPADALKNTVARYNELCDKGQDDDYGKRPEIMWPVTEPPFFAGQLISNIIMSYGGLRTDTDTHVLDENNTPIEGLYCAGLTAGEYYAEEYPTIVPGNGLGRGLVFGRIAGINAAGGDAQSAIPDLDITISGISSKCGIMEPASQQVEK